MATPYAELSDLEERFPRELTSDEEGRAETLLGDASFWLGVWVPGLNEAIESGNDDAAVAAKLLVVAMVRRNLLVPQVEENVQSRTEGPFTTVYRNPDGNLYLYRSELEQITGLLLENRATAVSLRSPGL